MKWIYIFTVLVLFVLPANALYAQEDSPISLTINKSITFQDEEPTIGSKAILEVSIEWLGNEDQVKFIPPVLEIEGFTIENTGVSSESAQTENGWLIQRRIFNFTLIAARAGKVTIPSFPIQYIETGKSSMSQIEVPGQNVSIRKPPLVIPWKWITSAGIVVFLLMLVFFIKEQKKKKKIIEDSKPSIEQEVLNEINRLGSLLEDGQFSEFMELLSKKISKYLSDTYQLIVLDENNIQSCESLTDEDKNILLEIILKLESCKYSQTKLTYAQSTEVKRLSERFFESKLVNEPKGEFEPRN